MLKVYNYHYSLFCLILLVGSIKDDFEIYFSGFGLTLILLFLIVSWFLLRFMKVTEDYIEVIYLIRPFKRKVKIDIRSIKFVCMDKTVDSISLKSVLIYYDNSKLRKINIYYGNNLRHSSFIKNCLDEHQIPNRTHPECNSLKSN